MKSKWKVYVFSDLCDISRGASPRPIQSWITTIGIPWVKISDANSSKSRYISQTRECIKEEGKNKTVLVYPEDLILSNSATPGIPKFMSINAAIHDGWLLLRNFRNIEKLYCYYLLVNERDNLVAKGNGSVFTNLKTTILKSHSVSLPPLSEQRAIARVLGSLDDKIELNRRMNKTLEEMAQAIFKSWFVENEQDFPTVQLADVFDVTMGQSPPGSSYNQDGNGVLFFQGRAEFGKRFPAPRLCCTEPKRMAKAGDTLMSVRAPVGDLNMALNDCCIGRGLCAIRHRSQSKSYTYYAIHELSDEIKRSESSGTVFNSINKAALKNIQVREHPDHLVVRFDEVVQGFDVRIELNHKENQTLSQIRDTLLPKLISGQIRIEDPEQFLENLDRHTSDVAQVLRESTPEEAEVILNA